MPLIGVVVVGVEHVADSMAVELESFEGTKSSSSEKHCSEPSDEHASSHFCSLCSCCLSLSIAIVIGRLEVRVLRGCTGDVAKSASSPNDPSSLLPAWPDPAGCRDAPASGGGLQGTATAGLACAFANALLNIFWRTRVLLEERKKRGKL